MGFTPQIANAASAAMTWLLDAVSGRITMGFMEVESNGSVWGVLGGLTFLGALVVAIDVLARRRLVRRWVPPLAVLALACLAITLLLVDLATGWREAAIMGTGLGAVVGCSFAAWWYAALGVARVRYARAAARSQNRA